MERTEDGFAPQTGAGRSQQLGIITSFMVPLFKATLVPCQEKSVPLLGARQDGGAKAARGRSEVKTYSLLLQDHQACCTHQQEERRSDRLSLPCL